jgi:hypothetical protein
VASARGAWETAGAVLCGLVQEGDANYAVRFNHSFVMPGWHMLLMMRLSVTFLFSFVRPLIIWPSLFLARES